MRLRHLLAVSLLVATFTAQTRAGDLFISTGDPDGKMAMASRPSGNGKIEIETADDFILGQTSQITNVSFTGLLTGGATSADISQVVVEIYRVFPLDSTVPPSGNVPTRDEFAFGRRPRQPRFGLLGTHIRDEHLEHLVHGGELGPERDQQGSQPEDGG